MIRLRSRHGLHIHGTCIVLRSTNGFEALESRAAVLERFLVRSRISGPFVCPSRHLFLSWGTPLREMHVNRLVRGYSVRSARFSAQIAILDGRISRFGLLQHLTISQSVANRRERTSGRFRAETDSAIRLQDPRTSRAGCCRSSRSSGADRRPARGRSPRRRPRGRPRGSARASSARRARLTLSRSRSTSVGSRRPAPVRRGETADTQQAENRPPVERQAGFVCARVATALRFGISYHDTLNLSLS